MGVTVDKPTQVIAGSRSARTLAKLTTFRPEPDSFFKAARWRSGSFPIYAPQQTGMGYDRGGGSLYHSNDPKFAASRAESERLRNIYIENRKKRKEKEAVESVADIEFNVEMAPFYAGTRAEYSTLASDLGRVHRVMPDPDAHPDDLAALRDRHDLLGVYFDRQNPEELVPLERMPGLDTDQERVEGAEGEWGVPRTPHIGSARAALGENQYGKSGHAYIWPSIASPHNWMEKWTDDYGNKLRNEPRDVIRHEVGHDASREFMYLVESTIGTNPHADSIGDKFVNRIGRENMRLWYRMSNNEEMLNRYEDFLVGSPADKAAATWFNNKFTERAKMYHKSGASEIKFLTEYRLGGLEERFTQEQLNILNEYHENLMKPGGMLDIFSIMDTPSGRLKGTKDEFGRPWELAGNDQDIDDLFEVKEKIYWAREDMNRAKDDLKAIQMIPTFYEAQMQGLKEHKESGGVLGSPDESGKWPVRDRKPNKRGEGWRNV